MKFLPILLLAIGPAFLRGADIDPVFHPKDVIVFQGDSITDGGRLRKGNDYNHTMGQDYAYIISGRLGAELAERDLTFLNRGISGNTVPDLVARWSADTIALKPNLLSILIGVNDNGRALAGNSAFTAEAYEQLYDKLLADTLAALPGVKIVLGEPFVVASGRFAKDPAPARAELAKRQQAVARLAAKYHLPLVRYQAMFDAACKKAPPDHWLWDGVHPTYAGHWLMSEEWLRTVNAFWPEGH